MLWPQWVYLWQADWENVQMDCKNLQLDEYCQGRGAEVQIYLLILIPRPFICFNKFRRSQPKKKQKKQNKKNRESL